MKLLFLNLIPLTKKSRKKSNSIFQHNTIFLIYRIFPICLQCSFISFSFINLALFVMPKLNYQNVQVKQVSQKQISEFLTNRGEARGFSTNTFFIQEFDPLPPMALRCHQAQLVRDGAFQISKDIKIALLLFFAMHPQTPDLW